MTKPQTIKKSRWSLRNILIVTGAGVVGTCLCLILVIGGGGGRETPTPVPPPARTAIPTWTPPFASPTIVEQVITLMPKPAASATVIAIRTAAASATLQPVASPTRTPAPATPLPTPAPALPTDTPDPIIVPSD